MSERKIRVLHLLNSFSGWGCGIVNAALDIVSGQIRSSVDVAVCSGGGESVSVLEEHGIEHFTVGQDRSFQSLSHAALSLRKVIRSYQPDIVHCHMITGLFLARAVRMTEEFGLVAHVHNVHQRSSVFMGVADRVIAVSDAVRADMEARGISARKLRVVQNGTLGSIRLSEPQDVLPRELIQPAIVSVAGLNHRKGIPELITAFDRVCRRVAHAQLYLVGSGPDRKEFEAQAAQSEFSSQIHFEGFQAKPDAYMKGANVFVLASRRDSFPLVLPEARQCGCAIVATNVDGIPEALDGGRAGILVPPQNPDALADAIAKLLEAPEEAAELRKRAGERLSKFRVERVATELTSVYRELLGARKGRVRPKSYSALTAPANE